MPYEPFKQDRVKPLDLLKNLKRDYVESSNWVPVEDVKEGLIVLTTDPEKVRASKVVSNIFPKHKIVYKVCTHREFKATLDQFFGAESGDTSSIGELLSTLDEEDDEEGGEWDRRSRRWPRTTSWSNSSTRSSSMLTTRAHPTFISSRIRARARPRCASARTAPCSNYISVPASYRNAIVARLKVMCDLDISEKRKPQDGKIKFKKFGPLDIELRVATIPSAGGVEDIVMRILAAGEPIPLDKLGLSQRNVGLLKETVSKPYGLFFVCGPTGSGKTTTLALRAGLPEYARNENLDGGGPGGNYAKGLAPGADEPEGGLDLCRGDEGISACRPGHHHGR